MDPGSRPTSTSSQPRTPLAPVRVSREASADDLFPAESPVSDKVQTVDLSLDLKKKDPLPPIVKDQDVLNLEGNNLESDDQSIRDDSTAVASRRNSTTSNTSRPPRIITAYRPEAGANTDRAEQQSTTTVKEETNVVKSSDEAQRNLVSIECQTEWSWLEDMRRLSPLGRHMSSRTTNKSLRLKEGGSESDDVTSQEMSSSEDSGRDATPHALERTTMSAATSRHISSALTNKESYTSEPFPPRDDEYGIPMLNLDSDFETTSDDDSVYEFKESDLEGDQRDQNVDTLPSIGPPSILQYQRESEKTMLSTEEPEEAPKDDEEVERLKREFEAADKEIFEGTCEFCNGPIKPFPTIDQQKNKAPDELYCCSGYNDFIQFMVTHPLHNKSQEDRMIDVKPHLPYGSKQARRVAKERAAVRLKEREVARQQAAMEARAAAGGAHGGGGGGGGGGHGGGGGGGGGASGPGFYQFARQMKTINFQLSSYKCLEEGWTLRPPSPLDNNTEQEVFEPEPLLPPWAESKGKGSGRGLVRKFYEDGSLFVALFPDGTGNVFYPSGRPAITISSIEHGLFYYIAQKDTDEDPNPLLVVFEPNGYGTTYYTSGNIRLFLDPVGGIELDPRGARKRKWSWKDQVQHVHAPPIQPITFAVTPQLAIRVMDQASITLTFSCRTRSCRFQVGSKLKLVAPENFPQPTFDEDELFRNGVRNKIESIMNRVTNLLKFPNCPRLDRLSTPLHLTSRSQKIQKIRSAQARSKAEKKDKTQNIITVN